MGEAAAAILNTGKTKANTKAKYLAFFIFNYP
jgi:hypothetical protein